MSEELIYAIIPVLTLASLFVLAAFWISRRAHARELVHRERLAMIEKGLVPPAELHPGLFDLPESQSGTAGTAAAARFRSAGIILVGLGVGVALVIGLAAGKPHVGVGIGGAIAAVGAAMIVNGMLGGGHSATRPSGRAQPPVRPGNLEEGR